MVEAHFLPGRDFHLLRDYDDDDEHGMARSLLSMLEESNIVNRILMVARFYDGTHIGRKDMLLYRMQLGQL